MNIDKVKDILYDYPYTEEKRERLNKELQDLLGSKYETSITAQLNGVSSSNRPISDKTGDAVIKIAEIYDTRADAIKNKINNLYKIQNAIETSFEKLDHNQKQIIELKYFKRYKWINIAKKIKYSTRNCYNLHDKAIEIICEQFKKESV